MLSATPSRDLLAQADTLSRCSSGLIYVAPATILTADPYRVSEESSTVRPYKRAPRSLREEASSNGVCYLHIRRRLACGDLYQADVAASLELLQHHPLSIFLTEEAFFTALTYDRRRKKEAQRVGGVQ